MSYKINFGNDAVALPMSAFENCSTLLELRFLMLLSHERELCDAENSVISERLSCTELELSEAVASLRGKKLISPERKLAPASQSKNLDGEQIAAELEADSAFKTVIDECQKICGRIFTPTDISKIVSLKKELSYDGETIILLFFHFAEKLDAVGKKISVSYVEKSAFSLYNQGIRSLSELQEYIKAKEEKNRFAFKIRKLFGMGERAFTKKEEKFFDKWALEWNMPFELIEQAYEIAVDKTGKAGLEYMSKILSDWQSAGITTPEEAQKSSEEFKKSDKYKKKFTEKASAENLPHEASFDSNEFYEQALRRSYEMMDRAGKEEN